MADETDDPARTREEEAAVARHARAFLRPALYARIAALKGSELGGWCVRSLYAIGGEGVLLRAGRSGQSGILKFPLLPYDRPVEFGAAEIGRHRADLVAEVETLRRFADTLLPKILDVAAGVNPLLADRAPEIAGGERFLVIEFLPGRPLDLELAARLGGQARRQVAAWLSGWTRCILRFLRELRSHAPGFYYTDLKPAHVRILPGGGLRLLDGGAIVTPQERLRVPISAGYCPRDLLSAAGTAAGLEAISLAALGRTLYASLLNKVLNDGTAIEASALVPVCGQLWADWIAAAAQGGHRALDAALEQVPD